MDWKKRIVTYSVDHPKLVTGVMIAVTIALAAMMPRIRVDTDPENMLSKKEAVRVFHNHMKKTFSIRDLIVLGVVNEKDPDGVFNPDSLNKIYELTQFAKGIEGVVEVDLIAPSEVDNIEQGGPGAVRFEWLMSGPIKTREEARRIRRNARNNPMLNGSLLSEDGKAVCLYIPIKEKKLSYKISSLLRKKIAEFRGDEQYYITGLPVAEDTFGVEMFKQMAISAPLAMLVIFALMFIFFRKVVLILSPMIVAMVSVIWTMGLLIGMGYTVHIMSSMIPIFLMPIAVVDSVHILSEFFDRYQATRDPKQTILRVMDELFVPMLYTSLTSAAGFASMALTPIPPVQVFGCFVAFGIMTAWVLTVTFIPAYTTFIPKSKLESFGAANPEEALEESRTWLVRMLDWLGAVTVRRFKLVLAATLVVIAVTIYGIRRIQVNDNPVKWFTKSHRIRIADRVLNEHFGGTYMAYLVIQRDAGPEQFKQDIARVRGLLAKLPGEHKDLPKLAAAAKTAQSVFDAEAQRALERKDYELPVLLSKLAQEASKRADAAEDDDLADAWDTLNDFFDAQRVQAQPLKQPAVLRYVAGVQEAMKATGLVGKSNSVADVVKKVYKELMGGKDEYFRIPDNANQVAQCLIQFESSHKPNYLWHLVTPQYTRGNIWVQLKSGDNKDMEKVVRAVDAYFQSHKPPIPLKHQWAGLTYLNIVWQNKMVLGMLNSFVGSFVIVLLMMIFLFRSVLWGLLSMAPLTITIASVYGIIGLAGKDYDMPVAVLSSLTLGLSVDFAIHFLERARAAFAETGSWEATAARMFGEPARAISRNAIVIAIGFLPLLAAPLVPYKTVGFFLASIMAISGVGALFILPALITLLKRFLFQPAKAKGVTCNCVSCGVTFPIVILYIAYECYYYKMASWTTLTWLGAGGIFASAMLCNLLSRRLSCRVQEEGDNSDESSEASEEA